MINICLLYHSEYETNVDVIHHQLITYGLTKWSLWKFSDKMDYNLHNYEERLNLLIRSQVILVFITKKFTQSESLKKELYYLEKFQQQIETNSKKQTKTKKIIIFLIDKLKFEDLLYESEYYLLSNNSLFIFDNTLIKDYYENFQILINFIWNSFNMNVIDADADDDIDYVHITRAITTNASTSSIIKPIVLPTRKTVVNDNDNITLMNKKKLLNENNYIHRYIDNYDESSNKSYLERFCDICNCSMLSDTVTVKPLTKLDSLRLNYEAILAHIGEYNNSIDMMNIDLNLIKSIELVETDIEQTLESIKNAHSGVDLNQYFYHYQEYRLPTPYLIHLMNLLMNCYYFKRFILKTFLHDQMTIDNQEVFKQNIQHFSHNYSSLFALELKCIEQQLNLIQMHLDFYDQNLQDNIAKLMNDIEVELKKENLFNIYENLNEYEKRIGNKKILLKKELTFKERVFPFLISKETNLVKTRLELVKEQKKILIANVQLNKIKLKKSFKLKQINSDIEQLKYEFDFLKKQKEQHSESMSCIEYVQYGKCFNFNLKLIKTSFYASKSTNNK